MLNKLFTLILVITAIIATFGTLNFYTQTEQEFEEQLEEYAVLDKTISCCAEISKLGNNLKVNQDYLSFVQTQNKLTKTLNKLLNFIMFPINLGLNLINCGFNCIAILGNWNYRSEILINYNYVDNDFSSGSSYGGGGGGFSGGR